MRPLSELDPVRSDALIRHLPSGQALLATAGPVPPSAVVESTVLVTRARGVSTVSAVDHERSSVSTVDNSGETVDETAPERVR